MKAEIKKISRSPVIWLFPLLFCLLFGQVYKNMANRIPINEKLSYQRLVENEKMRREAAISTKEQNAPADVYEGLERQADYYKEMNTAFEQKEWQKLVAYQAKIEEENLSDLKLGRLSGPNIYDQTLLVTELDYFADSPLRYVERFDYTSMPAVNFLSQVFSSVSMAMIVVVEVLFLTFYFTEEYRQKTIQFLLLTPQGKSKMLGRKLFPPFVFVALSVILGLGSSALIGSLKLGLGSFHYPLFYLGFDNQVQMITIGTYLLKVMISIFVLSLFASSLAQLVGQITKNSLVTLVITSLIFLPAMFPKFLLTLPQKGLPYLPFSYVDMPNLILDQNVWHQPMITWEKGVAYFVGGSLLCWVVSFVLLKTTEKKGVHL